jgi:hypothetical protein
MDLDVASDSEETEFESPAPAASVFELYAMQISEPMSVQTDIARMKARHPDFRDKARLIVNCLVVSAAEGEFYSRIQGGEQSCSGGD